MGLFTPKWKSNKYEKARDAIMEMTKASDLEKAALLSPLQRARKIAIYQLDRLKDQSGQASLIKVALEGQNARERILAATCVKDYEVARKVVLKDILEAYNDNSSEVMLQAAALKYLNDEDEEIIDRIFFDERMKSDFASTLLMTLSEDKAKELVTRWPKDRDANLLYNILLYDVERVRQFSESTLTDIAHKAQNELIIHYGVYKLIKLYTKEDEADSFEKLNALINDKSITFNNMEKQMIVASNPELFADKFPDSVKTDQINTKTSQTTLATLLIKELSSKAAELLTDRALVKKVLLETTYTNKTYHINEDTRDAVRILFNKVKDDEKIDILKANPSLGYLKSIAISTIKDQDILTKVALSEDSFSEHTLEHLNESNAYKVFQATSDAQTKYLLYDRVKDRITSEYTEKDFIDLLSVFSSDYNDKGVSESFNLCADNVTSQDMIKRTLELIESKYYSFKTFDEPLTKITSKITDVEMFTDFLVNTNYNAMYTDYVAKRLGKLTENDKDAREKFINKLKSREMYYYIGLITGLDKYEAMWTYGGNDYINKLYSRLETTTSSSDAYSIASTIREIFNHCPLSHDKISSISGNTFKKHTDIDAYCASESEDYWADYTYDFTK